ncbi:NF038122 family metalloprotease [Bradyrhizobium guangzhouense]|uniref:NF038122 family metalloprotease n=1 Tax=Bradyrhizobium guangzhouense TaxID=1325095 RepID=UPI001009FDA5|nr:NF038122 family metalloprotease [Bradyrhizobium guangzhouense]RXH19442.1 hypothetical protein EAS54_07790 [Bradyrhizobium guangzhouense]
MRTSSDELLSDDPFYTVVGNSIQGSYIPATSSGSTGGSAPDPVMSVTSGGITINLVLDAAAQAAPTSFKNGLQQAVSILAANITDKITVNINIDYSGTGGGAAAGPDSGYYENYSWVHSQLVNNATAGDTTFNSLPTGSTIQGQTNVAVWNAQLKLWGVLGANDTTTDDASANFATDINSNLIVGVALHELTHAMGRVPYGAAPDIFDFYRFTSPGVRLFSGAQTAPAAYFSLDGGNTKLADYGQSSDPSDFLNSGVQGSNDPFNEFYTGSTYQGLTAIDLKQLDALGFHLTVNSPVVIEQVGSTSLVKVGTNYFLDSISTGSGPMLKNGGAAVVAGAYGAWSPIAAEQVSGGGYDVAWKNSSTGYFSVWSTDSNGNYLSALTPELPGTDTRLETLETAFHQDLNGDGTIGVPTHTIEAIGSTSLVEIASNFYLDSISTGTGPVLKNGGVAVMDGNYGAWSPVAAEQVTGGGYDVAWKNASTGTFSVWSTDSNGNYLSALTPEVSGTDARLETLETAFHQDLNGDGTIGIPTHTIEAVGSTSLVEVGSNFYLDSISTGTGPVLKNGGVAVVDGNYGAWSPVAAEQVTGGGYDVAWKNVSTGHFSIWSTDSSGNYLTALTPEVSGTDTRLETLETAFHQDLNGDGTIGIPTHTIEAFGSTSLVEIASNFDLDSISTGTGPVLKNGGVAVVDGNYGAWSPVAAEQVTGGGYDVAFKNASTGYFSVWSTDSNGNYLSALTPEVSGTDSRLETLETAFHQDLNGDGAIGIPGVTSAASPSTSLVQVGSNFYLDDVSTGTGPMLKNGGAPVVAGNYGAWSPVAAEQVTGGGYDVAWKNASTGYFSFWSTDSNGNYVAAISAEVPGNSSTVQSFESIFHQDLNGDGVVAGPVASAAAASSIAGAQGFSFTQPATSSTTSNVPAELLHELSPQQVAVFESLIADPAAVHSDSLLHDFLAALHAADPGGGTFGLG